MKLSEVFYITKKDILDSRITDEDKLRGYIISQKHTFFNPEHPSQGLYPVYWTSWEEAIKDLKKNGILEPIIVTPVGDNKYKIIHGCHRVVAGMMAGLKEFPAQTYITEK